MFEEKLKKLLVQYSKKRNVIGGSLITQPREIDGKFVDDVPVIRIYVTKKVNECMLTSKDMIPSEVVIDGRTIKTDVVEIGELRALEDVPLAEVKPDPKLKYRPLMMGISTMNSRSTGGCSLGTFARDKLTGNVVQLSNQHCFGLENDAVIGDPIVQPSRIDGGDEDDCTGNFVRGVDIKFLNFECGVRESIHKIYRSFAGLPINRVDVSCADVCNTAYEMKTPDGTTIVGAHDPLLNAKPWAYGRSSGYSFMGEYLDLAGFVNIGYRRGTAAFQDVVIGLQSPTFQCIPGDSGSPFFEDNFLVGLRFAGSDKTWIGCKWGNIAEDLNVEFLV